MNLATYTLQIFGPVEDGRQHGPNVSAASKRVLANLPAMLESVEEDFTDMLPEGYTVKIERAL